MSGLDACDLPVIRVPDMERIRNARRKRQQQLKRWYQYDKSIEKDMQKKQKKGLPMSPVGGRKSLIKSVQFSQGIILLEAAARGDLDEVELKSCLDKLRSYINAK
ncbi:unnamed protein product [Dibothriocephalus latus]|uniref:Uncharacterized protein n=1 Tax=Dibothriocephalus latus TaxID=60516 RepID=A0A3P6UCM4_DIBLA|nr:unnamed protein product [Dibothriocephalus latus]